MVVNSQPSLDNFSFINTTNNLLGEIPIIPLTHPNAKKLIVNACEEFGFFKLVNHGVSIDLMARLESLALEFFNLPQNEKDQNAPPHPFGYGNKRIGHNGDFGWVEYILFTINPQLNSNNNSLSIFPSNQQNLWWVINEYISAVRKMACEVLELIADGLEINPRHVFSRMLSDDNSDSIFRLNYYAPCVDDQQLRQMNGRDLIGFGEHTDPQIISVVKSNDTNGLQICLKDGRWVAVPPDPYSFFINVDDSLQVMTNGRFKSVKHRVLTDCIKSRVSMIYFGGPPLNEKITPLPSLIQQTGEESFYKDFTWFQYKTSGYNSKLGDDRLKPFEKH